MSAAQQAQAVRDRLRGLEVARASLAASVAAAVQATETARRSALEGGSLDALAAAQSKQDAAQSVLDLHDQDVSAAQAELVRLERLEVLEARYERGKAALQSLEEAEAAHKALAAQAEQALSEALAELDRLSQQHMAAVAVFNSIAAAVKQEGGDPKQYLTDNFGVDWAPLWFGGLHLPRGLVLAGSARLW